MRHQATIQEPGVVTRDSYGGAVTPWQTVATVWAELDPYQLRDRLTERRRNGEVVIGLRIHPPQPAAKVGRRVVFEGANYQITELDHARAHLGELYIVAKADLPA
jgi:hypothetical protein